MSVEELVSWAEEEVDMTSKAFDDDISVTSVVDKGKGIVNNGKGSRNSSIIIKENVNPTYSVDDDFDSDIDMKQMFKCNANLEVGEKYVVADQLKECLTYYSLENGFSLWFYRSSKDQVITRCGFRPEKLKDIQKGKKKKTNKYPSASRDELSNCLFRCYGETTTKDQYAMIRSYGNAILESNDVSTFKLGCRPVIALDGCFLKKPNVGEILIAVERDGNNHIYPIAWVIVNIKNTNNWSWFLQLLGEDIDMPIGNGLTLILDQHKGLIEAVKDVMPLAEHIQCDGNIYEGFREQYSGV
ncbi:pentatricopeptide repeat-containing protein [Tanacetum coccineum]